MKAVQVLLLLCLFASFECEDIISKIACLVSNPEVLGAIQEVVKKIKEKVSAFEIAIYLLSKYEPVKAVVEKCFK